MIPAAEANPTTARRYRSLVDFYNDDATRLSSRERDIGLWWREGIDGPLYRAAWINETGELYLVRLGPTAEGGGGVEMLITIDDPERLEWMLSGWRDQCGRAGSLQWLRGRLARPIERRARRSRPRRAPAAPMAGAAA
jgi:hypothetical protein